METLRKQVNICVAYIDAYCSRYVRQLFDGGNFVDRVVAHSNVGCLGRSLVRESGRLNATKTEQKKELVKMASHIILNTTLRRPGEELTT